MPSVAIIGSFKQHYELVLDCWNVFSDRGIEIASPKGTPIIEPDIPFVRFESDPPDADDPTVQSIALHRILRSDAVYVLAPKGYVGKTTCYEIGRVVQAGNAIYFSEMPDDLPIDVPDDRIVAPEELARRIVEAPKALRPMHSACDRPCSELERMLLDGNYIQD